MFLSLRSIADEESVNLFFMSKAGGGEREMRQLRAGEMSENPLKDVFSVMYDVLPQNLQ